jgi:diguanylate cyclase (GGDEF)-like protein/PAS domain S-box-containing protein
MPRGALLATRNRGGAMSPGQSGSPVGTASRTGVRAGESAAPEAAAATVVPGHDALTEKARHLGIVSDLAVALLKPSKLEEILWVVARTAIGGLGFQDCVIYLFDESRSRLVQKAAYGPKNPIAEEILDPIVIPLGKGIVGSVALTGCSELVTDTSSDPRYILDDDARLSELAVPVVHDGEVIGVIDSEHPDAGFYTESHRVILTTIASMASTKIANALTIERLERADAALRAGQRRYRMLYDHHPAMFFTLDADGTVVSANTFAAEQLGYPLTQLVGLSLADLSAAGEEKSIASSLSRCLSSPRELHRWESCRMTRDGRRIWVRETARVVELGDDDDASILVVSEDITDTYNLARELKYQASHDSLTGLFNRREFELRIERALADARAEGSEHALCYLDLDQFKVINDTAGHVAGDELLRQLSSSLKERVRKSDVIARLGGDEFGVLIQHCSFERAMGLAQSLLEVVSSSRFHWSGQMFRFGASIGLVPITASSESMSELLAAADRACYAAKETGRNRIHAYSPDDEDLLRRDGEMRWAVRINEALERDQFELYFQPIRGVGDRRCDPDRLEILLRMVADDGQVVMPGSFLPAAERYGYSMELDRWVVRNTLDWLVRYPAALEQISLCAINLSGFSLSDDQFANFVRAEIGRTGLPPSRICFEITETAAISNLVKAKAFVSTMKELGCSFALDDFGSGLSSFAYLKNLPVDFLKIDGAFIKDLAHDPVDKEIVRSICEIAHLTHKHAVAEFVEDDATLQVLEDIGVDYAQGFHIGRPRPLSSLLAGSD